MDVYLAATTGGRVSPCLFFGLLLSWMSASGTSTSYVFLHHPAATRVRQYVLIISLRHYRSPVSFPGPRFRTYKNQISPRCNRWTQPFDFKRKSSTSTACSAVSNGPFEHATQLVAVSACPSGDPENFLDMHRLALLPRPRRTLTRAVLRATFGRGRGLGGLRRPRRRWRAQTEFPYTMVHHHFQREDTSKKPLG